MSGLPVLYLWSFSNQGTHAKTQAKRNFDAKTSCRYSASTIYSCFTCAGSKNVSFDSTRESSASAQGRHWPAGLSVPVASLFHEAYHSTTNRTISGTKEIRKKYRFHRIIDHHNVPDPIHAYPLLLFTWTYPWRSCYLSRWGTSAIYTRLAAQKTALFAGQSQVSLLHIEELRWLPETPQIYWASPQQTVHICRGGRGPR